MSTQAQCLCGAIKLAFDGPMKFAIRCHCRDCQRATGGGHAVQVAIPRESLRIDGALAIHHATADSGNALEFGFCSSCGSPLTKSTAAAPALTFLYAGALEDPADIPPIRDVFTSARLSWDTPPATAETD